MDPTARIVIEFVGLTTPIEGSLQGDDGLVLRFAGYMQLITAIETALQAARERIGSVSPYVGADSPLRTDSSLQLGAEEQE